MSEESSLKVLVVCGYYDFATPFFGIEYTVDHMGLEPAIRKNISFAYYESGHMVYIDEKAHAKLHKDIGRLYQRQLRALSRSEKISKY